LPSDVMLPVSAVSAAFWSSHMWRLHLKWKLDTYSSPLCWWV